jgi:phosphotriesterase-related protein
MDADDVATRLIDEIRNGIGDTGVRAGIIGEIGTSGISARTGAKRGNVTSEETKVLRGAARASLATGAVVTVHLDPRGHGAFDVLATCREEGLPTDRLILGHLDHVPDLDYHLRVADSGAWVQYDNFGREYYWDSAEVYWNNDHWRVKAVAALVRAGHARQLLLSQDVALKMDLRAYGGYGYDHILTDIVPALYREGLVADDIQTLLIDNPARALALRSTRSEEAP